MKVKSLEDLKKIKEEELAQMGPRLNLIEADENGCYPVDIERQIVACAGTGCVSCGCHDVVAALKEELERQGLSDKVRIIESGCMGICALGPISLVYPEGIFYQMVEPKHIPELVESHFKNGKPLTKLMVKNPEKKGEVIPLVKDIPIFQRQSSIVLEQCGLLSAASIDEYIAFDGYHGLDKALNHMSQDEICKEIEDSGLRGRGGAGFPTGTKWRFCKGYESDQKYVICNADEGDPGAFMDRSVLEGDPHAVLEGMITCAFAVGANHGYVYVRAEYVLAIERLSQAIGLAREYGLLGKNILGSGFDFDIEISMGAGAFVCGEETALMNSIEGKRGEPRIRPPFPAESGLWGKPTNINNVETYANVPWIIRHGHAAYSVLGSENSKGTKVLALAGDVANIGLVEVPMGASLRTVVFDVGGGVPGKGKTFKAAQLGGPSGGCIPAVHLDTPIDYENLPEYGAMMGSGGLIVMDNDTCMVDVARFFMEFVQDESCGKCVPCRIGTKRMLEALTRITDGHGTEKDLEILKELAPKIIETSLCGLGKTAPNPVISTMRYFMDEYEQHIRDKKCVAGVCKTMFHFAINEESCNGCTVCSKKCAVDCIEGERKVPHKIVQEGCIKCGECYRVCKFQAVEKVPGAYAS